MTEITVPEDLIPAEVELVGIDGNAFSIIGTMRRGLIKAGNTQDVVANFQEQALSGDYDHLLRVAIAFTA